MESESAFSELLRTGLLDVFASYANHEIECFKRHAGRIEELLQREVKDLTDDIEARMRSALSEQSAEAVGEECGEQHWLLSEKLPQIQRKGDFLAAFSLFESQFNQLCRNLESHADSIVRLSDLTSKGIDRARLYLEKVAQIRFPHGPLWTEIKQVQSIRNVFAHRDGALSDEERGCSAMAEYVTQSPYLDIGHGNIILIHAGFICHCLDIFASFFIEMARINKD